jgi:CrcB protein
MSSRLELPFPWATFAVNLLGGLLIGWMASRLAGDQRLFRITGFCGGFTTFSTYSMETVTLLEQVRLWQAAAGLSYWATK